MNGPPQRRARHPVRVEIRFEATDNGMIAASVDDLGLFNHALADSISSRAPRGAVHPGLSTYWIDRSANAFDALARRLLGRATAEAEAAIGAGFDDRVLDSIDLAHHNEG